jgi:hypothetical protein
MPRIRIILEDDEGNPIPKAQQRIYQLEGDCENLDEIERVVGVNVVVPATALDGVFGTSSSLPFAFSSPLSCAALLSLDRDSCLQEPE